MAKKQFLRWSLVSLFLLLVIWQVLAQATTPATTLDKLNVRGGPTSAYPVIGAVEINTEVTIIGRSSVGDRMLIQAGDVRGWVATRYLSWADTVGLADIAVTDEVVAGIAADAQAAPTAAPVEGAAPASVLEGAGTPGTVLSDKLNLRSGAGSSFTALAQLPINSAVLIEGRNSIGNWLLINTASGRGWVASRYIRWQISEMPLANLPVTGEVIGQPADAVTAQTAPVPDAGSAPAPTESQGKVIAASLNMRVSANRTAEQVASLVRGTAVAVEARNQIGDWVLVNNGAVRGWVSTRFIDFNTGVELASLPVSNEVIGQPVTSAAGAESNATSPLAVSGDVGAMEAQLSAVPIVPVVTARTIQLYQAALRAGRNPQRFTKIGDCNSENAAFMKGFDWNNYNLGSYGSLQSTVDYFSGSFAQDSVAGKVGYSAVTVIDSTWGDPKLCKSGEAPAYCEIRTSNASFVIIMFGANDISVLTPERYESALRRILDLTIQAHSVPILSTFTTDPSLGDRWAKALQLNLITINVAREYDLPVMNFWQAAKVLPSAGMSGDNAHLTTQSGSTIAFDGNENLYGFTMRNLVALQTLNAIRQGIGG